jgi:ureidoacrylate peracid hydrolase
MAQQPPSGEQAIDPRVLEACGLIVVDMQNGFCHPDGAVASRFDISGHRRVIAPVAELVGAAHRAGIPVFWSRQEHVEDDAGRLGHRIPNHTAKLGYLPCLRGTWDSEILDELQELIEPTDFVVTKNRASCFYNTPLETEIRMRGIDTLIVTGVATNYCVDATIRDAYARDLDLLIVEDACGSPWLDLHEATLRNAELFHGAVVSRAEVLEALSSAEASTPNVTAAT